ARGGFMKGIVAYADLLLGDGVEEVLDAQEEAGKGRFRGIRYRAGAPEQTEPPYDFLDVPEFRAGAQRMAARDLPLDLFIMADLIPSVPKFARSAPEQTRVFDHIGMPIVGFGEGYEPPPKEAWERRDEVFAQWRKDMTELATCPNVVIKVGGIGMPFLSDRA